MKQLIIIPLAFLVLFIIRWARQRWEQLPSSCRIFIEPNGSKKGPNFYIKYKNQDVILAEEELHGYLNARYQAKKLKVTRLETTDPLHIAVKFQGQDILMTLEKIYVPSAILTFLSLYNVPEKTIDFIHTRAKIALAGMNSIKECREFLKGQCFNGKDGILSSGYRVIDAS